MTKTGAIFAYFVGLVLTVVLCVVVSSAAIELFNSLPGTKFSPPWTGVVINTVPAFVTGFAVFFLLVRWLFTPRLRRPILTHFVRASPLYVVAGLLLAIILKSWRSPDFGLVAQLFVWPLVALVGGALGDVVAVASYNTRERRF